MTHFVVFPNLTVHAEQRPNPYIQDYIQALNALPGTQVVNPAHKNPLLSLLPPSRWGDVFIFNWFESIPDFKYGPLQTVIATVFLLFLSIRKKKIVWMLHNKRPHATGHEQMKRFLARLIAHRSTLIITHSEEGLRLVRDEYPYAIGKAHFIDHPTKCRLSEEREETSTEKKYDLLIWGTIARYKGVFEFVDFVGKSDLRSLRICIVGGASPSIYQELQALATPNITLINERPSFEKLADYISQTKFVLCPYSPESVLSSGMLMDSLSFGAKVIGPHVGSFCDYSRNGDLNVYTFHSFDEIGTIVSKHQSDAVQTENYRRFLTEHNWANFGQRLSALLHL